MSLLLWNIISKAVIPVFIIGILVGFYYFKNLNLHSKFLVFYIAFSAVFDALTRIFTEYNLYLIPLLGVFELFVFSAMYDRCLMKNRSMPMLIIRVLLYFYLAYDFVDTLVFHEVRYFNAYGRIIMDMYILSYGIMYFRKAFKNESVDINKTHLLFNTGVLIYFGFNFIFFSSVNFLVNTELDIIIWFWIVNAIVVELFYLFNMADWQNPQTFAIWLGIIVLFFGVLTAIFIMMYRLYFKRLLSEQKKRNQMEIEYQEKLISDSIQIQENERERIAADLHDNLISRLNILKLKLRDPESGVESLSEMLEESIKIGREISHDLTPPLIKHMAISELISGLLDELGTKYYMSFYHLEHSALSIHKDIKLQLLRIFQELINNIIRHSKANAISVYLRQTNSFLQLRVQDNGVGFNHEKAKSGLGLKNIELRIRSMNGSYKFKTPSQGGSVFLLSLNLH